MKIHSDELWKINFPPQESPTTIDTLSVVAVCKELGFQALGKLFANRCYTTARQPGCPMCPKIEESLGELASQEFAIHEPSGDTRRNHRHPERDRSR